MPGPDRGAPPLRHCVVVLLFTALAILAGSTPRAVAAPANPSVASPRESALVTRNAVVVRVRGARTAFRAIVGGRDVTRRFRRARGGLRVARLERRRDLALGYNRLVVGAGRGEGRRYAARSFIVGRRVGGSLRVRRRSRSRAALRLRFSARRPFRHLRITLNGRRVRTSDWAVGSRTPSTRWPRAVSAFDAMFGRADGLRFGRNRMRITAWGRGGAYDTVVRRFRITRAAPLVHAEGGRAVHVGRRLVFDGRRTDARRGFDVSYQWRIVDRPKGSNARLRKPRSLHPRLTPDKRGRYRVRLVARHVARRRAGARAKAAVAGAAAADEVSVEASPAAPPIGLPINTMANAGIGFGGRTYPGEPSTWAQLLVLDGRTLEVKGNSSFGPGGQVTTGVVNALETALEELDSRSIAVLSGGGRPATIESEIGLGPAFDAIGADTQLSTALGQWPKTTTSALASGRWSVIGVPSVSGSAVSNLFGAIYGPAAGAGSAPGALNGYLQKNGSGYFTFASGNRLTIDTRAPGAPAGVNRIRVGEQVYSSEQLPAGHSGFHVLVLDSLLERTDERTFITNDPGFSAANVIAMQQYLSDIAAPDLGTPGYLVVVQSIGSPAGAGPSWVNDESIAEPTLGRHPNRPVPRDDTTWFSESTGASLAQAIGDLAGPKAHDQIAQMVSTAPAPAPAAPGGFSLVASVGQLDDGAPVDPASVPESRTQSGARARIIGGLSRDRQSLWNVDTAGFLGLPGGNIAEIAYETPTGWPLRDTPEERAAVLWLTEDAAGFDVGELDGPDIRYAYYQKASANWDQIRQDVDDAQYPGQGSPFDQETFEEVREQISLEISNVGQVWGLLDEWQKVFTSSTVTGYIDLQTIASQVIANVQSLDTSASTPSQAEDIIGDALWIAGAFPIGDEAETAANALAGIVDLAADTATAQDGGPALAPVEAKVSELGQQIADSYVAMQSNIGTIGALLVSDWGKLAGAGFNAKNAWAFDADAPSQQLQMFDVSSRQEFYGAMLSTTFGQYVATPPWVMASTERIFPWDIDCRTYGGQSGHPFGTRDDNIPTSWITLPAGFKSGATIPAWYGLTTQGSYTSDGGTSRDPDVLQPSISQVLFEPLGTDVPQPGSTQPLTALGLDPVEFFADDRFERWWFYCARAL